MRTIHWIACAIIVAGAALMGCSRKTVIYKENPGTRSDGVIVVDNDRNGPPDHAPAHGYRKKHAADSVVLVYDSKLQVYIVESHDGCYYSAGQYFHIGDGGWEWSVSISGPWKVVKMESDLPPSLRKMKAKEFKSAKNNKKKSKSNNGKGDD